jgi:hypothetical protein
MWLACHSWLSLGYVVVCLSLDEQGQKRWVTKPSARGEMNMAPPMTAAQRDNGKEELCELFLLYTS